MFASSQDRCPKRSPQTGARFNFWHPDLVTLERFGGDGHVQSWNVDRPRYERAVRAFLERVAPAAAA